MTDAGGGEVARQKYFPFGTPPNPNPSTLPTDYRFTGQRSEEAALGSLYDYGARFYSPLLGRFISADTLVPEPGNPQALNRYAYVNNNPLRYKDPSGHWLETAWDIANIAWDIYEVRRDPSLLNIGALVVDVGAAVLPIVPAGVGLMVRGGKAAKAAIEVASHADEMVDAARLAGHMGDGVHAVLTASRLRQVGAHSDERVRLIKALAEQSTRGSGNRVVLGKWVEGGGYVAEAKKHGGIYFETAEGVFEALGKDRELAWAVNEQFLRNQLEAGVNRIELVGETISEVLSSPTRSQSFTAREIRFLMREAANYGYELVGNSWIKVR